MLPIVMDIANIIDSETVLESRMSIQIDKRKFRKKIVWPRRPNLSAFIRPLPGFNYLLDFHSFIARRLLATIDRPPRMHKSHLNTIWISPLSMHAQTYVEGDPSIDSRPI